MAARTLTTGTYALVIALDHSRSITIGRRGRFRFPAGFYLYVGSALGPGGLARRVSRHLGPDRCLHWHIDYLLNARGACVVAVWMARGTVRRECEWARAAAQLPGARISALRFGASDCHCAAHLIGFAARPHRKDFAALVGGRVDRQAIR